MMSASSGSCCAETAEGEEESFQSSIRVSAGTLMILTKPLNIDKPSDDLVTGCASLALIGLSRIKVHWSDHLMV